VLLIMSLASLNFITPLAAFALVLGANLGTAINPLFEGIRRGDPASYRLPVGNLLNRVAGIVLVAPFLHPLADAFRAFQPDMAKMTAEFHVAFNVALALGFIGLLKPLAALLVRFFPARTGAADPASPRHLEATALEMPSLALADAARETLRMADVVEVMLLQVMRALLSARGLPHG
jgi:phosphate:Na+ symporter